jgi:hypothetical protein
MFDLDLCSRWGLTFRVGGRGSRAAPPLRLYLWLLVVTGVRRGELCGLQIRDIDLDRGLVHVAFNYVVRSGRATPGTIWRDFLDATGTLHIDDTSVTCALNLRSHHPPSSTPGSPNSKPRSPGRADAASGSGSRPADHMPPKTSTQI